MISHWYICEIVLHFVESASCSSPYKINKSIVVCRYLPKNLGLILLCLLYMVQFRIVIYVYLILYWYLEVCHRECWKLVQKFHSNTYFQKTCCKNFPANNCSLLHNYCHNHFVRVFVFDICIHFPWGEFTSADITIISKIFKPHFYLLLEIVTGHPVHFTSYLHSLGTVCCTSVHSNNKYYVSAS